MQLQYLIPTIYLTVHLQFFRLHFPRNLELFIELVHDLLELHHLDAADQPHHRGLAPVLQLPRLQDTAHL